MTACSTLMAFGMMPLLLSIYCRGFNLQNTMPFLEITISLVMILIPCGIGVAINYYKPQYAKIVTRVSVMIRLGHSFHESFIVVIFTFALKMRKVMF